MTRFAKGQTVRALASAQGLTLGALYTVADVRGRDTVFGNFVAYWVRPAESPEKPFPVVNGHLLLAEVAP